MPFRRLLVVALFLTACTTTTTPNAATATATPVAATRCTPGDSILSAALWMQSSAEYQASALQAYGNARRLLDAALADPNWTAVGSAPAAPNLPPAIILDLDETSIDNSVFESRVIRAGKTYDDKMWDQWIDEANATAIPGAAEFLAYAASRGVTPFYVSNRKAGHQEEKARENLAKLGYPVSTTEDTVLFQNEREEWKPSDKGPRRDFVAATHRVLLLFGDDLNDFVNAKDKTKAERDQLIRDTAPMWGSRWIILPNAMYGSWEKATVGPNGTPCEHMQKRIDALRK